MAWIKNNKEFDTTVLNVGGLIIALVVVVLLFVSHWKQKEGEPLLREAIIMAIITLPQTIIAYAVGHKNGKESSDTNQRLDKIEAYLSGEDND